jgi:hypothetical protein
MSSFTFDLESIKGSVGSFESSLNANTPDDKLTYSGTDPIVWDRTNNERLRRGLSPLPGPRPVDDGKTYGGRQGTVPTSTAPNRPLTEAEKAQAAAIAKQFGLPDPTAISKTFELNCPPGTTREQAFEIFKKQVDAGGLTGFAPGEVLSAQTQATDGLPGALAQVSQELSGITGAFGANIPGAAGAIGSLSQAASGLTGSLGALAKGGLPSVPGFNAVVSGGIPSINSIAGGAVAAVGGALSSASSTNPIGLADFAKQAPALTSIGNMSLPDVTSVLAQAKKTVGQASTAISNSLGAGEFGLNVSQLESAGIVKPGTNSLITAGSSLTDVLKSPAVFTGKGGIDNLDNFLASAPAQSQAMQGLMNKGLNNLSSLGVPTDKLTAQGAGALGLGSAMAAGNFDEFKNLIKGAPIPAASKAKFDKDFADAAAAISLAESKIPAEFKAEIVPETSADTVNRETVTGALTRILGDAKIPVPNFSSLEAGLYAKTKDADLIYTGRDSIVWDRSNAERLRRGLPGLAEIGYPRPPDDAIPARKPYGR